MVADLGIRTVYDLRTNAERRVAPDRLPPGSAGVVVDVLRDAPGPAPAEFFAVLSDPERAREALADGRGVAWFADKYREFITLPSARAAYGRLFRGLAGEDPTPALIHCTTGKDRTGWAAAVLLLLLGVPDAVVEAEYLCSNDGLDALFPAFAAPLVERGGDPELLRPIIGVRPEYLATALAQMRDTYGTLGRYLEDGLGIGPQVQARLRVTFVEPA